jgi:hypothetical protein
MWRENDRFTIEIRTETLGDVGGREVMLHTCVPVRRALVIDRGVAIVDGHGASTVIPMTRAELLQATYLLDSGEG